MKTGKNENGYVLLMVLMLVLLFTVLGMALMTTNINSAKQFTLKENQVQARHQAEMGVLHYERILKEKINRNSDTALSCSDIDSLLNPSNKLVFGKYIIEPGITGSSSCNAVDVDKLKITIKSRGVINGSTEKEVKATFNVVNKGGSLTPPTIGPPARPTSPDTTIVKDIVRKKVTETFPVNYIVEDRITIDTGSETNLKFEKDLYVEGHINLTNHACIGTGGNFTALKNFVWGEAKSYIVIRKNAVLPSKVTMWKQNQTFMYIFGDLYLPQNHEYSFYDENIKKEIYNVDDRLNLFVSGKVYKYNGSQYSQITNPFKSMGSNQVEAANDLRCAVPEAIDPPQWTLLDEKIVDYN